MPLLSHRCCCYHSMRKKTWPAKVDLKVNFITINSLSSVAFSHVIVMNMGILLRLLAFPFLSAKLNAVLISLISLGRFVWFSSQHTISNRLCFNLFFIILCSVYKYMNMNMNLFSFLWLLVNISSIYICLKCLSFFYTFMKITNFVWFDLTKSKYFSPIEMQIRLSSEKRHTFVTGCTESVLPTECSCIS